jgi:hypothetical protein
MAEIGCGTVAFGPSLRVRVSPGGYPPGVCALVALVLPVWWHTPLGYRQIRCRTTTFKITSRSTKGPGRQGNSAFKITSRSVQDQLKVKVCVTALPFKIRFKITSRSV